MVYPMLSAAGLWRGKMSYLVHRAVATVVGGLGWDCTSDGAFAERCLTAWLRDRVAYSAGFAPATSRLTAERSTG